MRIFPNSGHGANSDTVRQNSLRILKKNMLIFNALSKERMKRVIEHFQPLPQFSML